MKSALLPEGALRELIAQSLKVHVDNEFQILTHLGQDLPGALVATPMEPEPVQNRYQEICSARRSHADAAAL